MSNNYLDTLITKLAGAKEALDTATALDKLIRQEIHTEMLNQQKTTFRGTFGKISLITRKNYSFSNTVIELEENLKAQKEIEKKTGVAVVSSKTEYPKVEFS